MSDDPGINAGGDSFAAELAAGLARNAETGQPEQDQLPFGLIEVGSSGLRVTGGYVQEEFLPELTGTRGREVYRQMSENDPVVGAFLFALNQMIGRLPWEWQSPPEADALEDASTDFVSECWDDMDDPWDSVLEDIMSFATYGWAFLEVVYKVRQGPDNPDGAFRSRFDDDRIGWRRFAPRGQNTLQRWALDQNGRVLGMIQMDPYAPGSREVYIPLAKAALFRVSQAKSNPEGRSMLRTAYRPWLFKTRIEEFEAIGIERDLVGFPVVYTPEEWHLPDASQSDKAALRASRNLVKNMRRGASEGAVIPSMFNSDGSQRIYDVKLITSGGARQIDIDKVLTRKNAEIAMSVLADFLMLGHEQTGTYNLGVAKVDLWTLSVQAVAKSIAEVMNRHVVPKLLYLNGFAPTRMPELVFGEVNRVDLAALGPFLKVLFDAGVITPDDDLEEWARDLVSAPAKMAAPSDPEQEDQLARQLLDPMANRQVRVPPPGAEPVPQSAPAAAVPAATPATPAARSDVPSTTPKAPVPPAQTVQTPAPVPVVSPQNPTQPTVAR